MIPASAIPRLLALTDVARYGLAATLQLAEQLGAHGQGLSGLICRERGLSVRAYLELMGALQSRLRGVPLLAVDRLDLAVLCQSAGLHVGGRALQTHELRPETTRRRLLLSSGWHEGEPLPAADLVLVSPVVSPRKGRQSLAPQRQQEVLRAFERQETKTFALGGITAATAPRVLALGYWGLAAIGAAYEEFLALLGAVRAHADHHGGAET